MSDELPNNAEPEDELPPELTEAIEKPTETPRRPIIEFSHVNIAFNGRPILEDVSFTVERGQTLCILGRSGVGKSVSLRVLMGFLKPDSGSVD